MITTIVIISVVTEPFKEPLLSFNVCTLWKYPRCLWHSYFLDNTVSDLLFLSELLMIKKKNNSNNSDLRFWELVFVLSCYQRWSHYRGATVKMEKDSSKPKTIRGVLAGGKRMRRLSRLINRWLNSCPDLDQHPEAVIHC